MSGEFDRVLAEEARRVADEIIREMFTPCGLCGAEHPTYECDIDLSTIRNELRGLRPPCPACGDVHEWTDDVIAGMRLVACDRVPPGRAYFKYLPDPE